MLLAVSHLFLFSLMMAAAWAAMATSWCLTLSLYSSTPPPLTSSIPPPLASSIPLPQASSIPPPLASPTPYPPPRAGLTLLAAGARW